MENPALPTATSALLRGLAEHLQLTGSQLSVEQALALAIDQWQSGHGQRCAASTQSALRGYQWKSRCFKTLIAQFLMASPPQLSLRNVNEIIPDSSARARERRLCVQGNGDPQPLLQTLFSQRRCCLDIKKRRPAFQLNGVISQPDWLISQAAPAPHPAPPRPSPVPA